MSNIHKMKKAFEKLAFPVYNGSELTLDAKDNIANLKDKRVTVILTGSDTKVDEGLKNLAFLKDKGFYITVVLSNSAEKIIGREKIEAKVNPNRILTSVDDIRNLVKNTDYCIAMNLTQNSLAKISSGIQDEIVSTILWQYLLMGVTTIVNTDAIFNGWFPIDSNKAMKKVMEDHLKKVEEFGAIFVENQDFLKIIKIDYEIEDKKDMNLNTTKEFKLVSESVIRKLPADKKELVVSKGIVITPLAKDLASSRGIKIIKR